MTQTANQPSAPAPRSTSPRTLAPLGRWFLPLVMLTALGFAYHLGYVAFVTPTAQPAAGGLAQKIFYFHVPAAYALYLSGAVCFLASAAYLASPSEAKNAWSRAAAEVAVVFGAMVLASGPLWAKKAWGVYWTWDPRLTTLLLAVLIYAAMVMLRTFSGEGEAERKFAAAFGVIGTVLLPIVHRSVQLWGGNHPTVIGKGGGGLKSPEMTHALLVGFGTMTLLTILLLTLRARQALLESRLQGAEDLAHASDLIDEESP